MFSNTFTGTHEVQCAAAASYRADVCNLLALWSTAYQQPWVPRHETEYLRFQPYPELYCSSANSLYHEAQLTSILRLHLVMCPTIYIQAMSQRSRVLMPWSSAYQQAWASLHEVTSLALHLHLHCGPSCSAQALLVGVRSCQVASACLWGAALPNLPARTSMQSKQNAC